MPEQLVRVFADLDSVSAAAALQAAEWIGHAPSGGTFSMALSGGSTPRRFHELLAARYRTLIPWERLHLFWGDERFVPPHDPASNFRMARETLIDNVPIPSSNIHPFPTEAGSPKEVAGRYERMLRRFFDDGPLPKLDLAVLGVGTDGHTASLFPGSPLLIETSDWVSAVQAPPGVEPPVRLTLTPTLLNQSRRILFLVAGADKREVVAALLGGSHELPAGRIQGLESTLWFLDEQAFGSPAPPEAGPRSSC